MIIGARAHDFGVDTNMTLLQKAKLIKECGYESIQLAPAKMLDEIPDIHSITMQNIENIHEILEEAHLPVSILGCYIEPALEDKEQRLRQVETFQKNIIFAKHLKTPIVGTETTNCPLLDERYREEAFIRLVDSVKRMAETAEKEDVYIGVEPVAEHTMNTPEMTRRLLDAVGSKKVKVIFDASNLLLPETVEKQDEIFASVYELLGDEIEIIHMKNFIIENGQKKSVELEKGVVDFHKIFSWLKVHKPHISLLREESTREMDVVDLPYIRSQI